MLKFDAKIDVDTNVNVTYEPAFTYTSASALGVSGTTLGNFSCFRSVLGSVTRYVFRPVNSLQ